MVETALEVELDLDQQLFSRVQPLTPKQFKRYARQHMFQFCQSGSAGGWLQRVQVSYSTIKAKKHLAYWVTLEHLDTEQPYVRCGGCTVWQYGTFRIAIWRLSGAQKSEPILRWERLYQVQRDRLSAVLVFAEKGRLFLGYADPLARSLLP